MFGAKRLAVIASGLYVCGVLVVSPGIARADEECPLGSALKSEGGETWCEPTVCENDDQCPTASVCRPVPLCVEVGVLEQRPGTASDAGQRLMVRQRCGVDKACPQRTTCSEKSRCVTRAQADKAGLLAPTAAASASAAAPTTEAPKKACGCHVPGTSSGELGGAALAMLGVLAIGARRRTRTPRRARL